MAAPAVSVVIAAYQAAPYLRDAVESVRRQTFQDLEVIVVDDGSTDGTWDVIQGAARAWDKVRPFRAEHGGTPVNKNRGIRLARGEWIALLDADDYWLPEKLRRCMDYLAAHPGLSVVYTPMATVDLQGRPMRGHSKRCHAGQVTAKIFRSIFVHDPAVVFHRRVVETCGLLDESIPVGSGHEFWLRVSTKFEFGLIDEPLAVRRWSKGSLTRSHRADGMAAKAFMLERFYFEKGGRDLLPRRAALRRLSGVHYSAAKLLRKEGDLPRAREHLARALRHDPLNVKAWLLRWACRLRRAEASRPA